jgi:hypothetical protein
MTLTCEQCAATVDTLADPGKALGWATEIERGVTHHICIPCTRAQVRDIEAKFAIGVR